MSTDADFCRRLDRRKGGGGSGAPRPRQHAASKVPPSKPKSPTTRRRTALRPPAKLPAELVPLWRYMAALLQRQTRVLASDTLKTEYASSARIPVKQAMRNTHLSFNNHTYVNAITIDIDHDDADERLAEFMQYLHSVDPTAPVPMIVRNWGNPRCHITWFMESPVCLNGDQRIPRFLDVVRRGLTMVLGGDAAYSNALTKNSLAIGEPDISDDWPDAITAARQYRRDLSGSPMLYDTTPGSMRPIGLKPLRQALERWEEETGRKITKPFNRHKTDPEIDETVGRNLFDRARHRVYAAGTTDFQLIHDIVIEAATELKSPATEHDAKHIARSIARFMRNRYRPRTERKPRPKLPDETYKRIKAATATAIAATRRASTYERITQAIAAIGADAAKHKIAAAAGVSTATVERWRRQQVNTPGKQKRKICEYS